jgi:UMF1 family MFS transporter
MGTATQPTSTARERWAWYLYDFGNSAYAAVVLLAVYSAYFQGTVAGNVEGGGSRLWGIAVGIAMFVVAISAPILGTLADFSGQKKRFLFVFTHLCVTFTALLFFVQAGNVFVGMLFFVLAEIGYRASQVFYNALLPEIASQEEMPKISGNGWAIGSFGGIICLLIVLGAIMVLGDGGNQVLSTGLIVRLSLIFTAIYFAVSALPVWLWLGEKAQKNVLPSGENYLSLAFKRLGTTFRSVRNYREFIKFIIAFLIYNDGILMVLDFGAILGAVLYGMGQQELIIFMIIVQLASVAGAYLFGLLADSFGGKRSLVVSLLLMIIPVVWLYFSRTKLEFYIIGGLAGFALTGVQSVSRTVVGMFSPQGKSAEFYGFFAVAGRTSSFIGPPIFGLLTGVLIKRNINLLGMAPAQAEVMAHRLAVFSILVFLVIGFGLLLTVNEARAKEAARARDEDADVVPVVAR